MFKLGTMYLDGSVVERSEKQAFECFKQADELGSIPATYNLGMMYINGTYVNEDKELGMEMVIYAARHDYVPAQEYLGSQGVDWKNTE